MVGETAVNTPKLYHISSTDLQVTSPATPTTMNENSC